MLSFSSLPIQPIGPIGRALANSANFNGGTVSAPNNKAILPFQIPVANPLTSAVQFVQGSVQDGLRNLDEGAKAVLATAPEIPLVHTDGTVTLVPGGLAGLQQLHDDAAKVIVGALNVESLDPTKLGATAATPTVSTRLAFPNIVNPFAAAANPLKTLSGVTQDVSDSIAATTYLPVVLPSGGLSVVKGGLEGLQNLQNDVHGVLENGAKLGGVPNSFGFPSVLGVANGVFPSLSLPTLPALPGLPGLPFGLGGGLLSTFTTFTSPETQSLIRSILAFPVRLSAVLLSLSHTLHANFDALMSEKTGPKEFEAFIALHVNNILKVTVLAIIGVLGFMALAGSVATLAVVLGASAVPVLGALLVLLTLEIVTWGHFAKIKARLLGIDVNGAAK